MLRLEVMVVFIFEKPRSACDIIEKPRSILVRLMTTKRSSGASTPTIHCRDFDKTGAESIQDFWTQDGTHLCSGYRPLFLRYSKAKINGVCLSLP